MSEISKTHINGFEIEKFNIHNIKEGATSWTCPECSEGRKKKADKCMSVFWDTGLGQCNHKGCKVQLHTYKRKQTKQTNVNYKKPEWKNKTEISDKITKWFESRGIKQDVLKHLKITSGNTYFHAFTRNGKKYKAAKREAVFFNYFVKKNGIDELVNVKMRGALKTFMLKKGCELILYNLNGLIGKKEAFIVEGELDVCTLVQIGIYNVVSVPRGAKVGKSEHLDYLDNSFEHIKHIEKFYMLVDNDEDGRKLEKELVRRLGIERCYHFDLGKCKDANEYYSKNGGENLRQVLKKPIEYPIADIVTMEDDGVDLDNYLINGMKRGYGIGIEPIDSIFTLELGYFCVFTSPPKIGKSTILDYFIAKWNVLHEWKCAIASPEYSPVFLHKERIITKLLGYRPTGVEHVNSEDYKEAKGYLDNNFFFIHFENGRFDLKSVLDKAKELVMRKGIKVLIIDPFNKVKFKTKSIDRLDYLSQYLMELDIFAKKHNILIIIVAHTTKMQKNDLGDYPIPSLYDIKYGTEWADMSPFAVGLARILSTGSILFSSLKVKFFHLGTNGAEVELGYNHKNGRITERDPMTGDDIIDDSNWIKEKKRKKQQNEDDFSDFNDVNDFDV
jgi:twinkle protein